MKSHFLFVCLVLVSSAAALLSCGGSPTPTSVPTPVPTLVPPTAAPTSVPPTNAPTATATTAPASGNTANAVPNALTKFTTAKAFRLNAVANVSPLFFQLPYTPAPGQDPQMANIFTMEGEQNGADLHYQLKGVLASLIAVFSGFAQDSTELELTRVNDELFLRGTLENETQARWYKIPAQDAANTKFSPHELVQPMSGTTYPANAFSKTGTETRNGQTCDVYTGSRAAFDTVYPALAQSALLNEETLTLETVDRAEFTITVCPDGNVHDIKFNFDAHSKANANDKGSFTFDVQISDYDANISIQAPADAVPMSGANSVVPTAEATKPTETKNFNSLAGDWEGASADESPIQFTVENDAITYANLNYSISSGSCSVGGAYGTSVDDGAIQNQKFSFTLTNSSGTQFTFAGAFDSNNAASGTLAIKGKTSCGDTDTETTWTAKHTSAPDESNATAEPTTEATAEATDEPNATPTAESASDASGVAMVNAVFDALAKNDVETALSYLSDDVVYTIGTTSGIGKDDLRSNLQLAQTVGTTFRVSNVQDLGGIVTFTVTVSGFGAGTYSNSSAIVQDGKVAILTIK